MAERENAKIEPGILQRLKFTLEQFHVPFRDFAGLVVGDAQGVFLLLGEVIDNDCRDCLFPKLDHRLDPRMAVDDDILAVDHDCADKAELLD